MTDTPELPPLPELTHLESLRLLPSERRAAHAYSRAYAAEAVRVALSQQQPRKIDVLLPDGDTRKARVMFIDRKPDGATDVCIVVEPEAEPPKFEPVPGAVWGLYGEDGVCLIQRGSEDERIAARGGERLYRLAAAPKDHT